MGAAALSSKRTILVLSAAAIALCVLGIGVPGVSLAATSNIPQGIAAIGGLLLVVAVVLGIVGWALALIKTANIGEWGWFVVVVLLNCIGALIYGLAGPETRQSETRQVA
jgi:hypothetical protein